MIAHKNALERLKAYEGVPSPYDKIKRMVIPDALKLQKRHKYCLLGHLSSEVGWNWNHYDAVRYIRHGCRKHILPGK